MAAIGAVMRTPHEPSGLVGVLDVTGPVDEWPWMGRELARVVYLTDHPHGYKAGEIGWYLADELRPEKQSGEGSPCAGAS